jgi:hypothetical protein
MTGTSIAASKSMLNELKSNPSYSEAISDFKSWEYRTIPDAVAALEQATGVPARFAVVTDDTKALSDQIVPARCANKLVPCWRANEDTDMWIFLILSESIPVSLPNQTSTTVNLRIYVDKWYIKGDSLKIIGDENASQFEIKY